MTLVLFFEGTGQGVAGRFTNVTRLKELCVEDEAQLLHLESGPGTHLGAYLTGALLGLDVRRIFRSARRWFEAHYETLPATDLTTHVIIIGFSRGALLARHFAAWLDKLGVTVDYLGLWDTVDATMGLDVSEVLPPNVASARHAVARDEARRFYELVPLTATAEKLKTLVFPGSHSDVGGLYEDNHLIADIALTWIADPAAAAGLRFKPDAHLTRRYSGKPFLLHDSLQLGSNLWGTLKGIPRKLAHLPHHKLCRIKSK